MPAWRYTIDLRSAIEWCDTKYDLTRHEEPCPEECLERLVAEVEKAPTLRSAWPAKIRSCRTIAELNRVLDDLYDSADRSRVWTGGGK